MRAWAIAACILALAAYLRLSNLADRPMHADEAIYAHKLGTLLETGVWAYVPSEYHGPVLHYLTVLPVRLASLSETTLRVVPAIIGVLLVATPLLLACGVGWAEAVAAAALIAVSPAMVYYSRYYIPEMLLTCLTAGLIAVGYRYVRDQRLRWALGAGLLLGLMFATKETAVIAAGSLVVATRRAPNWRHLLAALAVSIGVIALLLGPRETLQAISAYAQRAVSSQRHLHPWHYYLHLLIRSEAVILLLAIVGAVASKQSLVRFLAIYTLSMTVIYSAIPYKTPWCLLSFLYGMILLAGVGLVFLVRTKPVALALVAIGAIQLPLVDTQRVYGYAETSRDVYAIRDSMKAFRDLPVQVISSQNIWPLPWYLRDLPRVEWRRAVTGDMQAAPIILATPDMEPALLHHLYEVRPPGQRPLYVDLFSKYTELRSDVEIRGYVQQSIASGF